MTYVSIFQNKKILSSVIASICTILLFYGLWHIGANIGSLIGLTLFAMTPLSFTAIGECVNQKAGLINIGLEGMLLLGAIIGAMIAVTLQHWAWGIFGGAVLGALIGLIFGILTVYGLGNQIITGLGINLLGMGLTGFLLVEWGAAKLARVITIPPECQAPKMIVPGIGSITPFIFVAIAIGILGYYILNRTLIGIRIRATGEKPEAVDVAGTSVHRLRLLTAILGGALAGLGGAIMSVGWYTQIPKGIIGGRGFIALAIVIFAGRRPLWALLCSGLFGFVDAISIFASVSPAIKGILPAYFPYLIKTIPFLVPIIALAIMPAAAGPEKLCEPYVRE